MAIAHRFAASGREPVVSGPGILEPMLIDRPMLHYQISVAIYDSSNHFCTFPRAHVQRRRSGALSPINMGLKKNIIGPISFYLRKVS